MKTLALQGGGTRGKWQAVALQTLEQRQGKPLYELFEVIGGTSVGAINGGLIAAGLSAAAVNQFFDEFAPIIFSFNPWHPWRSIARLWDCAKYNPTALENSLKQLLGEPTLADCKTRFVATAVDMASGRNVYFQSYGSSSETPDEIIIGPDSGMKLWEVLRASSAAQSYFPGFVWRDKVFWDGGSTGCNAPDMLVLTEAMQFETLPMISMLSLGAGRTKWPFDGPEMVNPRPVKVVKATVNIAYACGQTNEVWQAKTFLGKRHLRLNPWLDQDFAIDDATKPTLAALTAVANAIPAFEI